MKYQQPTISDLHLYEAIIDVRSPAEFAEDHIPGAVNFPVLDDAQRAEVGTLYKQVSPFEAKKLGAALISENIAQHLKNSFINQPKSWTPLACGRVSVNRSSTVKRRFRRGVRASGIGVVLQPGTYLAVGCGDI